jgi:hypothetical protein
LTGFPITIGDRFAIAAAPAWPQAANRDSEIVARDVPCWFEEVS